MVNAILPDSVDRVGNAVSLAVRALRQDRIGEELSTPLRDDEAAWLDAGLG